MYICKKHIIIEKFKVDTLEEKLKNNDLYNTKLYYLNKLFSESSFNKIKKDIIIYRFDSIKEHNEISELYYTERRKRGVQKLALYQNRYKLGK